MGSSHSVFERVAALLEAEDLDCIVLEEGVALKTAMESDDGGWTCHIELAPLSDEITALVAFNRPYEPFEPAQRGVLLELLNALNCGYLSVGSFELDEEHEVTLRVGLLFEEPDELSDATIAHMLFAAWADMQHYLPALEAVRAGRTPREILRELAQERDMR